MLTIIIAEERAASIDAPIPWEIRELISIQMPDEIPQNSKPVINIA